MCDKNEAKEEKQLGDLTPDRYGTLEKRIRFIIQSDPRMRLYLLWNTFTYIATHEDRFQDVIPELDQYLLKLSGMEIGFLPETQISQLAYITELILIGRELQVRVKIQREKTEGIITTLNEIKTDMTTIKEKQSRIIELLDSIRSAISNLRNAIIRLENLVVRLEDNIVALFRSLRNYLDEKFREIQVNIVAKVEEMRDDIRNKIEAVKNEIFAKIDQSLRDFFNATSNYWIELDNHLNNVIRRLQGTNESADLTLISNTLSGITTSLGEIEGNVALVTGITEDIQVKINTLAGVAGGIATGVTELVGELSFMYGDVKTIKSWTYYLRNVFIVFKPSYKKYLDDKLIDCTIDFEKEINEYEKKYMDDIKNIIKEGCERGLKFLSNEVSNSSPLDSFCRKAHIPSKNL
jgi:hypothetical protein